MTRLTTLTASLLTTAALAPAAVLAASGDTELRGAPQLHQAGANAVQVSFTNDDKVRNGRVVVAGHGTATKVKADGRHGDDFKYGGVLAKDGLEVGRKYTMRISLPGEETIVRKVKLHPRRG